MTGEKNGESGSMIYEPHILHNPLLPFIFHTDGRKAGIMSHPNWHTNIEILMCLSGQGTVSLENSEHSFIKGDVIVISSNVLHSIHTDTRVEYDCLIIDRDFCRTNGVPTDNLIFKEKICDAALRERFVRVKEAYAGAGVCRVAEIRYAVLGLLTELRKNHTQSEQVSASDRAPGVERIKRTMVYIRQNLRVSLSLDDIALHAGISKYYFTREFKRVTGQTVFEYINAVRCKEAKRLISGGMTVSGAAQACGFENLSYFSRTYKKCIGELPSVK